MKKGTIGLLVLLISLFYLIGCSGSSSDDDSDGDTTGDSGDTQAIELTLGKATSQTLTAGETKSYKFTTTSAGQYPFFFFDANTDSDSVSPKSGTDYAIGCNQYSASDFLKCDFQEPDKSATDGLTANVEFEFTLTNGRTVDHVYTIALFKKDMQEGSTSEQVELTLDSAHEGYLGGDSLSGLSSYYKFMTSDSTSDYTLTYSTTETLTIELYKDNFDYNNQVSTCDSTESGTCSFTDLSGSQYYYLEISPSTSALAYSAYSITISKD